MNNKSMERKLDRKEAIDISHCEQNDEGDYILSEFISDIDYCDRYEEEWIWSIGRDLVTNQILASTSNKFYENPGYECLWIR